MINNIFSLCNFLHFIFSVHIYCLSFIVHCLFIENIYAIRLYIQFIFTTGNANVIVKPSLSILSEPLAHLTTQLKSNCQNESKPAIQQVFFSTTYINTSISCKNQDRSGNKTHRKSQTNRVEPKVIS